MDTERLRIAGHFAFARWRADFRDRAALEAWQQARLRRFLREVLPRAPRFAGYRGSALAELPIMDKPTMMADFAAFNTCGVTREAAMAVALAAERSRDFRPVLRLGDAGRAGGGAASRDGGPAGGGAAVDGLTVGLSSGTSGNRGLFLVSRDERLRWAGVLLARALPASLLRRLIAPWRAPLRVAFFLRAGSKLYDTLGGGRIDFRFHDLLAGIDAALPALAAHDPDVLVAPASVLRALCAAVRQGRLALHPRHVIAVAEVLEPADEGQVRATLGVPVHGLYQATEGFLGYTCALGHWHLNEAFLHIEPEWLDAARTRFRPVITDFSRETQLIVRYRLDDVLRVRDAPCPCGRADRALSAIEGRCDEVLWLPAVRAGLGSGAGACAGDGRPSPESRAVPVFADGLRRALALAGDGVREYRLVQQGTVLRVELSVEGEASAVAGVVRAELQALWMRLGVAAPELVFGEWQAPAPGAKRRRVVCERPPEGLSCTF